ncbi:conserved hypothetical protein [Coccidioides posadasii str. Silveira]|uniref:Protein kinase domain-containing protein n=1 Tax=Coccidioides posadasii (strain RMSCC 757 / Silveira) TaxID=443226 RepID=E9D500_COCPS|nr:conserved hypothetical protein [Coccidioides posadasii str. Silveira]
MEKRCTTFPGSDSSSDTGTSQAPDFSGGSDETAPNDESTQLQKRTLRKPPPLPLSVKRSHCDDSLRPNPPLILQGIAYIHRELQITHGSINCQNVFVSFTGRIKIGDIGGSMLSGSKDNPEIDTQSVGMSFLPTLRGLAASALLQCPQGASQRENGSPLGSDILGTQRPELFVA